MQETGKDNDSSDTIPVEDIKLVFVIRVMSLTQKMTFL